MPSSRAMRSRRRYSQDEESSTGTRLWLCAFGVEERSSSWGRDSPNIIERSSSSTPMRSLITRLVMRLQKPSSSRPSLPTSVFMLASSSRSLSATETETRRSELRLCFRLRVSFCISSTNNRDCSILHRSILLVRSTSSSRKPNSTLSLRRFTLPLRRGLYRSKAYKCSCTSCPAPSTLNDPRPSCVGNTVPLSLVSPRYTEGSVRNSCRCESRLSSSPSSSTA